MTLGNQKNTDEKKEFCTCMDHGSLTIFVRARPWHETAFVQVLLPVAMSYETFLCKLCVALDVDRALVKKVLKIPDVLVRTTEDVIRLRQDDRLEVVLRRSLWKHNIQNKIHSFKPYLTSILFTLLLAIVSAVAVRQKEILDQLNNIQHPFDKYSCHSLKELENGLYHGAAPAMSNIDDGAFEKRLKEFETQLINRLTELEKKLEGFVKTIDSKSASSNLPPTFHFQTLQELTDQLAQLRNLLRRKMKVKEDE